MKRALPRLRAVPAAELKVRHVALGLLMGGMASSTVHAQAVDPVTELTLSADVRHDSNVIRSSDIFGVTRGIERSDERLSVGAALDLARPFGPHSVAVKAFVGYDFYRRNTELNSERLGLSGEGVFDAGICQISLLPSFARQQSSLYDLAVINAPGIDSVRNVETIHSYRGEVRCGNAFGIRPLAYYERSFGNNNNRLRRESDYRGETFGAGLSYEHPVLGQYDLSAERTNMNYPNRPAVLGLGGYKLDKLKLATQRDIGSVLKADGYVAYARLRPRTGNVAGFSGLSWSLGLTIVPVTDIEVRVQLAQDIQPSLGNDALYSRNRDWRVQATYQLGARSAITAAYSRNDRLYRGASPRLGPVLTSDRLDQVSGRFDYSPSQRLGFGIEVGHERRNANGTFYDYKNTYVAFSTRFKLGAF